MSQRGFLAEVTVRPLSADELRLRELGRRATALKATDIHAAIQCLKEAQAIAMRTNPKGHSIDFWLRLPLFMQQAGDINAAEVAFYQIEQDIRSGKLGGDARARSAYLRTLKSKRTLAHEREARSKTS